MADPLTIAAIIGLAYAGRKMIMKDENPTPIEFQQQKQTRNQVGKELYTDKRPNFNNFQAGKDSVPSFGVIGKEIDNSYFDLYARDRFYISGKMNNLSPVEKQLVGPGLGVDANVPATGGFQQLYRVNPTNVGAYKLTTLPGRSGPAADTTGGRRGVVGELTHDKPTTTAYLPSRLPNVPGRAQGQGGSLNGVAVRGSYQRTMRPTARSEMSYRGDALEYGPAKSIISARTLEEDPTRNKGDLNDLQYKYNNQPTPGIYSFHGGYTQAPTDIRPADKRGQRDRTAGAGRMNVRADPLNQNGLVTNVRSDCSRIDGRLGGANGGWQQNYVQAKYYQHNPYKGNINPTISRLDTAKKQLVNNPFAHSF